MAIKNCVSLLVIGDKHGSLAAKCYKTLKFDIIPQLRPDIIVINGDWMDCNTISSHVHSIYNVQSLKDEIEETIDDLAFLRKHCKQLHFNAGNHCHRMFSLIEKVAPQLMGVSVTCLEEVLQLKKLKISYAEYGPQQCFKPWHDERLAIMHKPISGAVNCAMTTLQRAFSSVIFNHVHRAQCVNLRDIYGVNHFAISNACMCDIDHKAFNYMPSKNDWKNGFTRIIKTSKGLHEELITWNNGQFKIDGKLYD